MPKGTNPAKGNAFRSAVSQAVTQNERAMVGGKFRAQDVNNVEQAIRSLQTAANRRRKIKEAVASRKDKLARGAMLDPKVKKSEIGGVPTRTITEIGS